MNQFNEEQQELFRMAEAAIPSRTDGEPLFPLAWHARIFALIVTLVKNGKVPWIAFQQRLVARIKQQGPTASHSSDVIDMQYFDCWLQAAEETILAEGYAEPEQVGEQIARIRRSVAEIREGQLKASDA